MPWFSIARWVGGIILALLAAGGVAYGADQHVKRKREQEMRRAEQRKLDEKIAAYEVKRQEMRNRFGEKNAQVRTLAKEIARLRAERTVGGAVGAHAPVR